MAANIRLARSSLHRRTMMQNAERGRRRRGSAHYARFGRLQTQPWCEYRAYQHLRHERQGADVPRVLDRRSDHYREDDSHREGVNVRHKRHEVRFANQDRLFGHDATQVAGMWSDPWRLVPERVTRHDTPSRTRVLRLLSPQHSALKTPVGNAGSRDPSTGLRRAPSDPISIRIANTERPSP